MQVNLAGIRRDIKNLAHNYSDAQVFYNQTTDSSIDIFNFSSAYIIIVYRKLFAKRLATIRGDRAVL